MPNPVKVQPPGSDCLFIILLVITSRDCIPLTPLDDIPPDPVHSPKQELNEEITQRTYHWLNSHRKFLDRLKDRLSEPIRLSSVHPPIKGFTDASAD